MVHPGTGRRLVDELRRARDVTGSLELQLVRGPPGDR
jgi:hypothetical protein